MPNYKQEGLLYHYLFESNVQFIGLSKVVLVAKITPANAEGLRDHGFIPGSESPWGGHGNQLQCLALENPTVGYSPIGSKSQNQRKQQRVQNNMLESDPDEYIGRLEKILCSTMTGYHIF